MIPGRERANKEPKWAVDLNPGPRKEYSLYVAATYESIASRCNHMDRDRTYMLGPLYDTGRYAGRTSERHLLNGYRRCMEHGQGEAAKIRMSHVFMIQDIGTSIGEFDVTPQDYEFMKGSISGAVYDDYNRLVQFCDSLAPLAGFCPLEARFVDVTIRYEVHPGAIPRWKRVLEVKDYFGKQMGCIIYEMLLYRGRLQRL